MDAADAVDFDLAERHMDPRDLGVGVEPSVQKARRSYEHIPHDPELWRGKGLSPFVERLMTEGHRIGGEVPDGFCEIGQYEWKSTEAQRIGGLEADRGCLWPSVPIIT